MLIFGAGLCLLEFKSTLFPVPNALSSFLFSQSIYFLYVVETITLSSLPEMACDRPKPVLIISHPSITLSGGINIFIVFRWLEGFLIVLCWMPKCHPAFLLLQWRPLFFLPYTLFCPGKDPRLKIVFFLWSLHEGSPVLLSWNIPKDWVFNCPMSPVFSPEQDPHMDVQTPVCLSTVGVIKSPP